ncbi:MAG: hypothetical protein HC905_04740 [Bacteroidales bacterium]|nr:hypothetical protein [Bacteroidales bacterium]
MVEVVEVVCLVYRKTFPFSQLNLSGGEPGTGICYVSSTGGSQGDSLNRLLLPLTGFLNNLIYAESKTCYNTKQYIKGSKPQGGNGAYTYLWEYRDNVTSPWIAAPGKNDSIDYKTAFLTDTSQFRRKVTSDGMTDISRSVTINVFPQITNNVVDPDTTLCYGSKSVIIRGAVAGGGKGNIQYEWSQRTISSTWELAPADVRFNKDLTILADESRYYRRKATSEYCSIYDSVKVDILPVITNNLVSPRQTICSGAVPASFQGSTPVGGNNGSYKYRWQRSDDSLNWTNEGISVKDFANPPALSQTRYYRRIVLSGLNDCCRDTSKNIKIIVLPNITNNSVSSDQTICEASKPDLFNGSQPLGGDIIDGYRYKWEISKNGASWDSVQYSDAIINFQANEQDSTRFSDVLFFRTERLL